MDEMIALFDLEDVNAAASTFNPEKLNWINQQYIQSAHVDRLTTLLAQHLESHGLDPAAGPALADVVEAYRDRAVTMREMAEDCAYLFADEIALDEKAAKKHLRPVVAEPLAALRDALSALEDWQPDALGAIVERVAADLGLGMGKVGQPARVAVTGSGASPGLGDTLALVGKSRALARLERALGYIEDRARS